MEKNYPYFAGWLSAELEAIVLRADGAKVPEINTASARRVLTEFNRWCQEQAVSL